MMTKEEYIEKYGETDEAPGWEAIDARLAEVYGGREPDAHWAATLPAIAGGNDFLDGVSFYRVESEPAHYHFVSYGLSQLYFDEAAFGGEFSKFGFELTFRLKPFAADNDNPSWVFSLMQNLARYVYQSGKWFDDYHYLPANSPVRLNTDTEITALTFVTDPALGEIETVHGAVKFLQIIGITQTEFDQIKNGQLDPVQLVETLKKNNELLITDLERQSAV